MKKLLLIVICIVFALCMCGCTERDRIFIANLGHIQINDDAVFYDEDSLEKIFFDYQDDFEQVKEIVLSDATHYKYMQSTSDSTIRYLWHKEYFSEDEWDAICNLLKETKLMAITRYSFTESRERGGLRFYTISLIEKNTDTNISVFYLGADCQMPFPEDQVVKELCDNWYIIKQLDEY